MTPLFRMAWAISWASSLVRASTFSVKMCLPALAAASSTSLCWLVAVVTWMPWMELSAQMASKSGWKGTPSVWAMAWPRAWSSSHRQASWACGFFKMAWAYSWVWTCHAPITAIFIQHSSQREKIFRLYHSTAQGKKQVTNFHPQGQFSGARKKRGRPPGQPPGCYRYFAMTASMPARFSSISCTSLNWFRARTRLCSG